MKNPINVIDRVSLVLSHPLAILISFVLSVFCFFKLKIMWGVIMLICSYASFYIKVRAKVRMEKHISAIESEARDKIQPLVKQRDKLNGIFVFKSTEEKISIITKINREIADIERSRDKLLEEVREWYREHFHIQDGDLV